MPKVACVLEAARARPETDKESISRERNSITASNCVLGDVLKSLDVSSLLPVDVEGASHLEKRGRKVRIPGSTNIMKTTLLNVVILKMVPV